MEDELDVLLVGHGGAGAVCHAGDCPAVGLF